MYLKLTILVGLLSCVLYYYLNYSQQHIDTNSEIVSIDDDLKIYTKEELANYVTEDQLYLAILGHVYDVTRGKGYYKKGETYHCFVGKDGSKAFVSGNFTDEGLTEDIDDITGLEALELNNWLEFYSTRYTFKGYVIGRFYDEKATPTRYWHEFQLKLKETQANNDEIAKEKLKYPPCNIAWSQDEGSRVWCSKKSGGIERDWVGVPRKLYEAGQDSYRCACINLDGSEISGGSLSRQGNLGQYENCHPESSFCIMNPDDD